MTGDIFRKLVIDDAIEALNERGLSTNAHPMDVIEALYDAGKMRKNQVTHKYDDMIRSYWSEYMVGYDWLIGWGQICQESAFNRFAVSPAGASGLCQFMPKTWSDMIKKGVVPDGAKPTDPEYSIRAGAHYMRSMMDFWTTPRPRNERIKWALASYNWGAGNVLKAQNKAGGSILFQDIIDFLPAETAEYPFRINKHVFNEFGVDII